MQDTIRNSIAQNALTYSIETYGCQMNAHESEKIAGVLESLGFTIAEQPSSADVVIYNTCCIRQHAEAKLYSNIGALKEYKDANQNALIVVCGCMMQQQDAAKKLMERFPYVDIVFGTNAIHRLEDMLYKALDERVRVLNVSDDQTVVEGVPIKRSGLGSAYVNIIYGCNNYCSYCVVPYVRGRERSRKEEDIISEVQELCQKGAAEITLLGQNVNSYSDDTKNGSAFAKLLHRIDTQTDIKRLRFMTSHPKDMSDELIDCYGSINSLCEHVHLPVQSGSNAILHAMNRRYTREHYLNLLGRLKQRVPSLAVTTDIIVGFPGESEEDFAQTLSLVEEAQFDAAYTFAYSPRAMTKAASLPDQISKEVKSERLERLNALVKQIMQSRNSAYLGRTVQVLIDGTSRRSSNEVQGRTREAKTVNMSGCKDDIGKLIDVKIDKVMTHTLRGERV